MIIIESSLLMKIYDMCRRLFMKIEASEMSAGDVILL